MRARRLLDNGLRDIPNSRPVQAATQFAVRAGSEVRSAPDPCIRQIFRCLESLNQSRNLEGVFVIGGTTNHTVCIPAIATLAYQADQVRVSLCRQYQAGIGIPLLVGYDKAVRRRVQNLRLGRDGSRSGCSFEEIFQPVADLGIVRLTSASSPSVLPFIRCWRYGSKTQVKWFRTNSGRSTGYRPPQTSILLLN